MELADSTRELSLANAELRSQTAFLEAHANCTIDGSLVVDARGQVLLRNQRLLDIFRVPSGLWAGSADHPLLAHAVTFVKNPESFLAKVRYLYDHPSETSRDEIELKNGTMLDRANTTAETGTFGMSPSAGATRKSSDSCPSPSSRVRPPSSSRMHKAT